MINYLTLDGVMQPPGLPTRTAAEVSSTAASSPSYDDAVMAAPWESDGPEGSGSDAGPRIDG